jgi:hypothetical protein
MTPDWHRRGDGRRPAPGRSVEDVAEDRDRRAPRRRAYFWLMGTCVVLILLAWNVVRLWSTTAAVVMSIVAAVIPPVAAFVGNLGAFDERGDGTGSNRSDGPPARRRPPDGAR